MSWVSPIKDDEILHEFEEGLKEAGEKYYVLFEIGVGTGLKLPEILDFRNEDVRAKETIELNIGKKNIRRIFKIPGKLQQEILSYTEGKDPKAWLFPGRTGSGKHLSKEQASRVMKRVGEGIGLPSIGASSMRKTFAWNYYKATNDIYYLQNLLNHASSSITYQYIGESPKLDLAMKERTPRENQRSRCLLGENGNGERRIRLLKEALDEIEHGLKEPGKSDDFYGRVDFLLTQMEKMTETFKRM